MTQRRSILIVLVLFLTVGNLTGLAAHAAREAPFRDLAFDFILLDPSRPPCDCGEYVERFGGPIEFDADRGIWMNEQSEPVNLLDRAKTDFPSYPGETVARIDPNSSYEAAARAIASLGEAGICEFTLPEFRLTNEFELAPSDEGKGEEMVYNRLYAFRLTSGQPKVCRRDEPAKPAEAGYSRNTSALSDWP